MRGRLLALLLPALISTAACGPSLSAEAQWVQWFSYRAIFDMAVSPEGEAVVVGRSTSDEAATDGEFGQFTQRPWIARVAADGMLLDDWTGYLGEAWAVAMDAEGQAYVLLRQPSEAWGAPYECELRALDRDGQVRWSTSWDPAPRGCPTDVAIAGDAVVVLHEGRIEALELDGRPRWQQPAVDHARLSVVDGSIWLTGLVPDADLIDAPTTTAWRHDARDGKATEVSLGLGDGQLLGVFVATTDALIVTSHEAGASSGAPVRMTSFTFEGRRQWEREVVGELPEPRPAWALRLAQSIADGREVWLIGAEQRLEQPDSPQSSGRQRMLMQRWSSNGEHEGTLRHSFEDPGADTPDEADPAVLARSECQSSDVVFPPVFGSQAVDAVARPDGTLLVAGAHGCRDAFLLRLEVAR